MAPEELTRQREAVLVRRAMTGDRRAHDELVVTCLPAIGSMARGYRGASTIAPEEFIQAGVLGLLRALARFDPSRGTPFWAYASWWAHVSLLLAASRTPGQAAAMYRDDEGFERVERRLAGDQLRDLPGGLREREREVLRARFGLGRPRRTLDEIATELGITGERVRQIEAQALDKVRGVALSAQRPCRA